MNDLSKAGTLSRGEVIDVIIDLLNQADAMQQMLIDEPDISYDLHSRLNNLMDDLEDLK
jgi:hypothetical protein